MIEAKKRVTANIASNFFLVITKIFIGLFLTKYLIDTLGLEVYSLIPLVQSFIAFFDIFTISFSTSIQRFVSIYVAREDYQGSKVYFSSAISVLLFTCIFLLVPLTFFAIGLPKLFKIPIGYEMSASIMTFIVILASFITSISAPFTAGAFIRHRFDLDCMAQIASKVFQVTLLLLLFKLFSPMLEFYGFSFIMMSGLYLLLSIFIFKRLLPNISFDIKVFRWKAVHEMANMGSWTFVNQIGALLYLSISYTIVNIFLGTRAGGFFGAISQLIMLISVTAGAISNVFTPIAYTYISKNDTDSLVIQTKRAIKYIGIFIAFPIGICCGLASPLLTTWLGPKFSHLNLLTIILLIPWQINATIRPIFALYKGFNKVKTPAIVTLSFGILHIILTIVLVNTTNLGLYAIGLSLLLCHAGKNFFFTPIYAAIIVGRPYSVFQNQIYFGLCSVLLIYLALLLMNFIFDLASIPKLLSATVSIALVYFPSAILFALSKEERKWLIALIKAKPFGFQKKIVWPQEFRMLIKLLKKNYYTLYRFQKYKIRILNSFKSIQYFF